MYLLYVLFFSALAESTQLAIQHPARSTQACPPVWNTISSELTTVFLTNNTCNADARAAIRGAFHDCFPIGGCDGSIFLAGELSRAENWNIGPTIWMLGTMAKKHDVGVADMIQFAAAHAIVTCPQGPRIEALIGRVDSCTPAPLNQVPGATITGDDALQKFQARGFTAEDLAALMGAHTVSEQIETFKKEAGKGQDTTPDLWDNAYYRDTLSGQAPFSFPTDVSLSNQTIVGPFYSNFSNSKTKWDNSFVNAMKKMSLLGTTEANVMINCTGALPE